jgi:hypothetical protein
MADVRKEFDTILGLNLNSGNSGGICRIGLVFMHFRPVCTIAWKGFEYLEDSEHLLISVGCSGKDTTT